VSIFGSQTDGNGAVLCASEIRELCEDTAAPLMTEVDEDNFIGAKYDLRMADTGLVLPNGKIVDPTDQPYREDILLGPGETAFVRTRERMRVPLDLVGNMSIKGDLSRKGILSLTGLIVDPGYRGGENSDGRLHFRLANLGSGIVVLQPGVTRIASIQFLRLAEPAVALPEPPDIWARKESLAEGLGFIDEIKSVKAKVDDLSIDFERQKRSVNYVLVAGILVILATLLGVAVSGVLSLGADSDLVRAAKNVIPDDSEGRVLAVVLILGVTTILASAVVAFAHRVGSSTANLDERVLARQEALRQERVLRHRRIGIYLVLAVGGIALAISIPIALASPAWVPPVAAFAVLLAAVLLFPRWAWKPIRPDDVQNRLREWQSG
jgi:dCTP deaminase